MDGKILIAPTTEEVEEFIFNRSHAEVIEDILEGERGPIFNIPVLDALRTRTTTLRAELRAARATCPACDQ